MIALILFGFKTVIVLGAALLLTTSRWFTASARHLILVVAIVSLPFLLALGELNQNSITITPPGLMLDWQTKVELPVFDSNTVSQIIEPVVAGASVATTAMVVYGAISATLLLYWLFQIATTAIWIRRTRVLPSGTVNNPELSRQVTLRQSDRIGTPLTWGLLHPDVVVPGDWANWPKHKSRSVLLHELAHVQRMDSLTSLLSAFICCVFWINPLVWIAHRRLLIEAERACDDVVINHGIAPTTYAGQLLEIARSGKIGAATAMASSLTLPTRIHALLNANTRRNNMSRSQMGVIVALALLLILSVGCVGTADGNRHHQQQIQIRPDLIMLLRKVTPEYPVEARREGIEGYVVVEFVVTATGAVSDPVVVESSPPVIFDQAAIEAVGKFKYKPSVVNGQPVDTPAIRNRINFELAPEKDDTKAFDTSQLSDSTLAELSDVQKLVDDKDFDTALLRLTNMLDTHQDEPSELGQIHNMRGFVYFSMEDYSAAIGAYEEVLKHSGDIPRRLETTTLYTLAQLTFVTENYLEALDYISTWVETVESPGPEPFIFMGQVYYQIENYPAAIEQLERGIEIGQKRESKIKENWWGLLNYLHYELEHWDRVIEVLEVLRTEYPNEIYDQRLRGIRAMLVEQDTQPT